MEIPTSIYDTGHVSKYRHCDCFECCTSAAWWVTGQILYLIYMLVKTKQSASTKQIKKNNLNDILMFLMGKTAQFIGP